MTIIGNQITCTLRYDWNHIKYKNIIVDLSQIVETKREEVCKEIIEGLFHYGDIIYWTMSDCILSISFHYADTKNSSDKDMYIYLAACDSNNLYMVYKESEKDERCNKDEKLIFGRGYKVDDDLNITECGESINLPQDITSNIDWDIYKKYRIHSLHFDDDYYKSKVLLIS